MGGNVALPSFDGGLFPGPKGSVATAVEGQVDKHSRSQLPCRKEAGAVVSPQSFLLAKAPSNPCKAVEVPENSRNVFFTITCVLPLRDFVGTSASSKSNGGGRRFGIAYDVCCCTSTGTSWQLNLICHLANA